MESSSVIIFAESDGGWRVGVASRAGVSVVDVPVALDATPEARVEFLAEALRAAGVPRGGADVVLALETNSCLCASIATGDLPARQRGQAMLYRFEEKLPVPAEELVAGFISAGNTALGIAAERRKLQPLVDVVQAAGVRVRAVCPASLLALQQWLGTTRSPVLEGESHIVLWQTGAGVVELFILAGASLVGWFTSADDPDDVALLVRMATLRAAPKPARLTTCGIGPETLGRLEGDGVTLIQADPVSPVELGTASIPLIRAGKRRPWVDLAQGGGARGAEESAGRAGAWAAAAAAVFLACLAAAMLWRAARYERLAARYEAEQQAVFHAAFPGQAMPAYVRSRMESEARQAAVAGAGRAGAPAGQGLVVLRDVMTHLPTDVRFRVLDVRLDDGRTFVLEGEARSHGDAEAVAAALRRRPGFAVASPRTRQYPGRGVGFTLTGGVVPAGDVGKLEVERRASR